MEVWSSNKCKLCIMLVSDLLIVFLYGGVICMLGLLDYY